MEPDYEKRGYLLEDFRLFHLQDAQGTRVDYHYHEFCKLLLLRAGSGCYGVEGRRYGLVPGDVVLIPSGCVHRPEFEPGVPYNRTILYISPEFLRKNSTPDCDLEDCFTRAEGPVLRLAEAQRLELFAIADRLEQELSGSGFGREILSRGLVLRLLVEIGRDRENAELPSPARPGDSRVREMVAYLDAHLTQEITVEDLARKFYLSKYHMMRLFRRETGESVHGYLTQRRLLHARELMTRGISATEACFQSGWGSYSSFSRAYAKQFGSTPTGRREPSVRAEETYE